MLLPVAIIAYQRTTNPGKTIKISKETTFVTEHLNALGLPDYVAALNARQGAGVTPETNTVVKLVEAMGPRPEQVSMEFHEAMAAALGITPLPEHGPYLASITDYLNALPEPPAELQPRIQAWIDNLSAAQNGKWQTADYPDMAGWIHKNEIPLQELREGLQRPHYYRPVVVLPERAGQPGQLISQLLPDVQSCRQMGRLLTARAMWHLGEGRVDEAIQDLLDGHRLARKVVQGWTLIEGLVGIAIEAMTSHAAQALLIDPQLTAAQARFYREQLEQLGPVMTIEQLARTIDQGERLMGLDFVIGIASGQLMADDLDSMGLQSFETVFRIINTVGVNWNRVLSELNQHYDKLVQACEFPERADRLHRLKEISRELDLQRTQIIGWEGGVYLLLGGSGARGQALAATLCGLLSPAIEQYHEAMDRSTMRYETLLIALALAEYHRTHGHYPTDLNHLKPEYREAFPDDLYSGNPLIYHVSDDGLEMKIYSVGKNGIDDNGPREGDLDATGKRSDDIGFVDPIPQPFAEVEVETETEATETDAP